MKSRDGSKPGYRHHRDGFARPFGLVPTAFVLALVVLFLLQPITAAPTDGERVRTLKIGAAAPGAVAETAVGTPATQPPLAAQRPKKDAAPEVMDDASRGGGLPCLADADCDDGNPCTDDKCSPLTGTCLNPCSPAGQVCDDGNVCTAFDACDGACSCTGVDISAIQCGIDGDCPVGTCDIAAELCVCDVKCIPIGDDCFTTKCDGSTFVDFTFNLIPGGYFFPGSSPFGGQVQLGGAGGFPSDTSVRRLDSVCFDCPLPQTRIIPIEIVQLDLISCTPVFVDGACFNAVVRLAGPSPGDMTITKDRPDGGVFKSNLNVQAQIEFFPCGATGGPPVGPPIPVNVALSTTGNASWQQDDPGISSCNTPGFYAGFGIDSQGLPCCYSTCHDNPNGNHPHCVIPPDCPPCPLCDPADPLACDDGDVCTIDKCDPVSGVCSHGAIGCLTNGDCPAVATCDTVAGICVCAPCPGTSCQTDADCDDGDPCTQDACDPDTGTCSSTPTTGCIPPGIDCWTTAPEEVLPTKVNLCDCPPPPDFFGPGCALLDTVIDLTGALGNQDTIVQRLDLMQLPLAGAVAITPLEIVELNLVSLAPITVGCGGIDVLYDVQVNLSDFVPSLGTMTVTKSHDGNGGGGGGGTFDSELNVVPKLTFTSVADPAIVFVLDTGDPIFANVCPPDQILTTGAPWSHKLSFAAPPGAVCGTNFVPGAEEDPTTGSSCCVPVCHAAATATHCNEVGFICPCCPTGGACCDPADPKGCITVVAEGRCSNDPAKPCTIKEECSPGGLGGVTCCVPGDPKCGDLILQDTPRCPEGICVSLGRIYRGDGTDCTDSDGDGLPDVVESGGTVPCCTFDGVSCDIGTDPNNPDSDGDGTNDGDEVMNGRDPCQLDDPGCTKPVPAGNDCWSTACGGASVDFSDTPIPAGFFGPGSQPFDGTVFLRGATGGIDTQVARLQDMCLDGPLPQTRTIDIEMVQLDLVSCEPVTVNFNDGTTQLWTAITRLTQPQPVGSQMTVNKTVANGGTYDTTLNIAFDLQFILGPVSSTLTGQNITIQSTGLPWAQVAPGIGCGTGFHPGADPNQPCCEETCHSSFGQAPHEHCVKPPDCVCCNQACCFNDGSCQDLDPKLCRALDGSPRGAGTACQGDLDGNGRDDACEFDQPCEDCGGGGLAHWIDNCPAGTDYMPTGAVVGLDLDLDCIRETNLVLTGAALVGRDAGTPHFMTTEILSMTLTGGGTVLRAGAGGGVGATLLPSPGLIVEQDALGVLADSTFDVRFEIDLGGGIFLYNHTPLTIYGKIDCVPPDRIYTHFVGCLPLFSSPTPGTGVHLANLTSANHDTFPPENCPLPPGSTICAQLRQDDCIGSPTDLCLPRVVTLGPVGLEAVECSCFGTDGFCGPVDVSPDGDSVSCPGPCPNPAEICQVFIDGAPSGSPSLPASALPPGALITCDCPKPLPDPHITLQGTSATFGSLDVPSVPADFFEPGSDPFNGTVNLVGGPNDTLGQRDGLIVCPGAGFPRACNPVGVELIELSLVSASPIVVQPSGTQWDVEVSLSPTGSPPPGVIIANLLHANGGRYNADIPFVPVFTFTEVGNPANTRSLDYDTLGRLIRVNFIAVNWVVQVNPGLGILAPNDGNFVPGVSENIPGNLNSQKVIQSLGESKGGGIDHPVQPPPITEACCFDDGSCLNLPAGQCIGADGAPRGPGTACQGDGDGNGIDDACEFDTKCQHCGPGAHWIDTCPAGHDRLPSGAVVGVDLDGDCIVDRNLVMFGPAEVARAAGVPHQILPTEMVAMRLSGGGAVLRAGAGGGVGPGAPLGPSLGSIIENGGDPTLGDSSFGILFELDLGAGIFAYNQAPLIVTGSIVCVAPNRIYEHVDGCLPLFDSPIPGVGNFVANLVSANHDPFGDPLCPLSSHPLLPCHKRQIFDCVGSDQERCLPRVFTTTVDGTFEALLCECFDDQDLCGPVTLSPNGDIFSCNGACPDPDDRCEIHIAGVPSGAPSVPVTAVPPGAEVTCDCVVGLVPPVRAAAPHNILKNRYISIDPSGGGVNPSSHHIRVTVNSSLVPGQIGSGPWWAGALQNGNDLCATPCLSIVTTTKPGIEPDWSGCPVVHLTGCPIIPTSTYGLAVEAGGTLSAEALFDTQAKPGVKWHADSVGFFDGLVWTDPNGTTNIDDAVAGIKTFQDCGAFNAAHLSRVDLVPNLPGAQINLVTNINDVFTAILGFQGAVYPNPDLNTCP